MKKIKTLMIAFMTFLSVGVMGVSAEEYSENFKKLTSEDTIIITNTSFDTKDILITEYISAFRTDNYNFILGECNEDYSSCKILGVDQDGNVESHDLKIEYNEEYSEEFKKLTSDGTLVIKNSTIGHQQYAVDAYIRNFNDNDSQFYIKGCNEDMSICTVGFEKSNTEDSIKRENHNIKITFKEEYSEEFKKLTDSNNLEIKSIKPTTMEEAEFFITTYVGTFNHGDYTYHSGACNEDYTVCDIYMGGLNGVSEVHKINVTYSKIDEKISTQVNKVISSLPVGKKFVVEDLEFINYIVNGGYDLQTHDINVENAVVNYSSELKEILGNGNITAKLDVRAGWGGPFNSGAFGGFIVLYDDTAYGLLKNGGAEKNHIIYIPDDTANTSEAFIAAAKKRITNYLKNKKVELAYGGKLSEFGEGAYADIVDASKMIGEFYTLTYDGKNFPILIAKDSSKIKDEIMYSTNDIMTNISISTDSSFLPFDTTIKVKEITKENKKYNEIITKLDVKDALIYDLKLYSSSKGNYISKLDDGTFSVSIPLPENMKNKPLAAYYIKDDGTIEEYEVKVVNNMAIFNTKHFSIYTIAEKQVFNEEIPNTYDGINNYIIMAIISLLGLCGTLLCLKNKQLN